MAAEGLISRSRWQAWSPCEEPWSPVNLERAFHRTLDFFEKTLNGGGAVWKREVIHLRRFYLGPGATCCIRLVLEVNKDYVVLQCAMKCW